MTGSTRLWCRSVLAALVVLCGQGCANRAVPLRSSASQEALPELNLTLGWNREAYVVPSPAVVPEELKSTRDYQSWLRAGDVRTLRHVNEAGQQYEVLTGPWMRDPDGVDRPMIMRVDRRRPDGTLELSTLYLPEGPESWMLYGPDGSTPAVRVVNRLSGVERTPFIAYVRFFNATGREERAYQANGHRVVYLEWFYDERGNITHWNGSARLDTTPERLGDIQLSPATCMPDATSPAAPKVNE